MTFTPLDDPTYSPTTLPQNGHPPDVVAKWGRVSQLRWFRRFQADLKPWASAEWERFYCESEHHRGMCCVSCVEESLNGYYDGFGDCCHRRDEEAE